MRWYLCYKLRFRDLVEMMGERGLRLSHTTSMRWVQRYAPEFEKRWSRFARKVGRSWHVDETYLKVRGRWVNLYRAVDQRMHIARFPVLSSVPSLDKSGSAKAANSLSLPTVFDLCFFTISRVL
jgi:transposase-like protein